MDDHTGISDTLVFAPDRLANHSECRTIDIRADMFIEESEAFNITLTSDDPAVMVLRGNSVVHITDRTGTVYSATSRDTIQASSHHAYCST